MNDFFDKIFVINLDRRVDRMEHVYNQASSMNMDIERFSAFDGTTLTSRPGKPPHRTWATISMGNYGNILSQRALIQKAIDNKWESLLILEDDFQFYEPNRPTKVPWTPKERVQEYLENIPKNWDMIYFGGNHQSPLVPIDNLIGRCSYTLTAHAVGIRNTMYEHILYNTRNLNVPIDLSYAQLHNTYNVYSSIETLATQMAGYSDIEERNVDYSTIIK